LASKSWCSRCSFWLMSLPRLCSPFGWSRGHRAPLELAQMSAVRQRLEVIGDAHIGKEMVADVEDLFSASERCFLDERGMTRRDTRHRA